MRLKQDSLGAWVGLGSAFEALAQYPKAVDAFERAISVAPYDALLWQELGQVYIKQGQRERATEALKRSLVLDPAVPQTHQLLGTVWMKEDPARAETFFREAIRIQPEYPQALTNLAVLLSEMNRTEEAAFNFERAIRLRPNYALAHLNYGVMLRNLGHVDAAIQHARRAAGTSDEGTREAARRLLHELGAN